MRKLNKILPLIVVMALVAACASTSTVQVVYKIDAATVSVVDTAMTAYGELFRAGKISPDLEKKIDNSYLAYQKAMSANILAGKAYAAIVTTNTSTPEQLTAAKAAADKALAEAGASLSQLIAFLMQGGVPQTTFSSLVK